MPLTGELTDLSLAELIEFFCNQRKAGRLEVVCPDGSGHFYLDSGSIVHAQIGVLSGIEAVHYALTLTSASFTFGSGIEAPEKTIAQSWQSVVLEGLRLIDEGVTPATAFLEKTEPAPKEVEDVEQRVESPEAEESTLTPRQRSLVETITVRHPSARINRNVEVPAFLIEAETSRSVYGPWKLAAVLTAMILVLAVIAVPWGWYARSKAAKAANEANASTPETAQPAVENSAAPTTEAVSPAATGSKMVTVQVTYDETGQVTQVSGDDPAALQIARQKRFPAGKAGSATLTIPIN